MPKYLLLKHYRGGPDPYRPFPPMDQWAPEDVEAHMTFLGEVSKMLQDRGEYVDAQALTQARTWVRYGGPGAAPVTTDGPHPRRAIWWPVGTWSTSTVMSARWSWRRSFRPSPARAASPCMSGSTFAK